MKTSWRFLVLLFAFSILPVEMWAADCTDYPNPYYEDINADGIDGDASIAIFVSPVGNDGNPGTMSQPVSSIAQGIAMALANGKSHVYVAGGDYYETVVMQSGVSVYGQYSGPPNWGRSSSNITSITGAGTAVLAESIAVETHLEGFTLVSTTDNTAPSGYGIRVVGGSGLFYIRYNDILPGPGMPGVAGANGSNGGNGGNGARGQDGCNDCSANGYGGAGGSGPGGCLGGTGGRGGYDSDDGQRGGHGQCGPYEWGFGGLGGNDCYCTIGEWCSEPGYPGEVGANGPNGSNGAMGSVGSIINGFYVSGNGIVGTDGYSGQGGGGGGGGGGGNADVLCRADRGGGGGGGGGGGAGGTGGVGGTGGGTSMAILVDGAAAVIDGNFMTTSAGGAGGQGGIGNIGGNGGSGGGGGWGPEGGGDGGVGGVGGRGGAGGAGSGGSGGASVGIYVANTENVTIGSTNGYSIASGGTGGTGGTGPLGTAPSGPDGVSANIVGGTIFLTPVITAVVPDSGVIGDSIIVLGANFGATPGENEVCIGLGSGNCIAVWPDSLCAEVVAGATTGRVKVTRGLLEAYSPTPFQFCAAAKGDMNADANLSPADVVMMLNCVFLGSGNCGFCFADVNCSGDFSPADVVLELNAVFLAGSFPC